MDRWKLVFEYDGVEFSGWQEQPDARTVEDEIEKAFSTLFQQDIDIIGQGRTDAGVHAKGQVAHADLPPLYTSNRIIHAMRGLLPRDVTLLRAEITNPDFHARFSAVQRSYSYHVIGRLSPLLRNRAWCYGYSLDVDLLHKMAAEVKQNREFVNFCIPEPDNKLTTECTITQSNWDESEGNMFIYRVGANRFLRHMVRRLVGSMMQVAAGRQNFEWFQRLLEGKQADQKGHSAPAHGLYLESVTY